MKWWTQYPMLLVSKIPQARLSREPIWWSSFINRRGLARSSNTGNVMKKSADITMRGQCPERQEMLQLEAAMSASFSHKTPPFPLIFWMFSILDKIFHDYEMYNVNTFWFAPEIIQVCRWKWVFTSMCFDAASLYSIFTHNLPDHPIIGEYRHIWRWPYAPGRNI